MIVTGQAVPANPALMTFPGSQVRRLAGLLPPLKIRAGRWSSPSPNLFPRFILSVLDSIFPSLPAARLSRFKQSASARKKTIPRYYLSWRPTSLACLLSSISLIKAFLLAPTLRSVTQKADGTRYLLLLLMGGAYLVTRDFKFRRCQVWFFFARDVALFSKARRCYSLRAPPITPFCSSSLLPLYANVSLLGFRRRCDSRT